MSTALARSDDYWLDETGAHLAPLTTDPTQRLRDWVELFRDVVKAAEYLSQTPFVPTEMVGKPADVAASIMKGYELGMDPLDALANIYVVNGRVSFYAEFMRRRIIQAGHTFRVAESTDTRATVEAVRKDTGETHRVSFTAEQARNAGTNRNGKPNIDIRFYPADKLLARATSRLCRQVFPDVLSGSLIAEDLIDGLIPAAGAEPAAVAAGPPVQRKRATRKPRAAHTQPPAAPAAAPADISDDAELLGDDTTDSAGGLAAGKSGSRGAGTNTPPPPADPDAAGPRQSVPASPSGGDPTPRPHHDPPSPASADLRDPAPQPAADAGPEPPATKPQNRKMHALFREIGLTDRDDRLIVTGEILGYTIDTSSGLTIGEASKIIDTIERWQADPNLDIEDRVREILNTAALREVGDTEQGAEP